MLDTPLIISLLVFTATLLFVVAYLVHLGYVRGHQTLVQKIKQDGLAVGSEEGTGPVPPSRDSALKGRWLAIMARLGGLAKPKGEEGVTHIQRLFLKGRLPRQKCHGHLLRFQGPLRRSLADLCIRAPAS